MTRSGLPRLLHPSRPLSATAQVGRCSRGELGQVTHPWSHRLSQSNSSRTCSVYKSLGGAPYTQLIFLEFQGDHTKLHNRDSRLRETLQLGVQSALCTPSLLKPPPSRPPSNASWGSRAPCVTLGAPHWSHFARAELPSSSGTSAWRYHAFPTPGSALSLPHPSPGCPLTFGFAPLGCICLCFSS